MSLKPVDLLHLTYRSLRGNLLRSCLTTLGVFMGVAAVNATLQVDAISRAVIADRLAAREAPQITLFPEWSPNPDKRARLQQDDLDYLQKRLTGLQAASTTQWWYNASSVLFQDQEANPQRFAVSQTLLLTSGYPMIEGRFFTEADFTSYRPVAVINQVLAAQLFDTASPVGQVLYADRQPYTVVGVILTKPGSEEESLEGELFIPMTFYSALTGDRDVGAIRLRPTRFKDLEIMAEQAESLLKQRFPGQEFYLWNNVEDIQAQQKTLALAAKGLTAVGVISLLVGGVGIANIMIAAVAERTSEIGLKRAIGATRQEIMLQFILEATLLSLVGGAVAIASVHVLTLVISQTFQLPYQFNHRIASLSLGAAVVVGVGASFAPALQASRLDPVTALRSD